MKALLTAVNAKYIHSNPAVYNLRAYAGEYREFIEIAEYTVNHRKEAILQDIYKKKPDILCFSCYIWNYDYVREIAAEFHKLRLDVPIWVGGPEASYEIDRMFEENPAFYGAMIGEGEAAFKELMEYYCGRSGKQLSDIAGIAYRNGEPGEEHLEICRTRTGEPLDFGTVPFCYEDMQDFKNRIVYYESSRGCPFSCSYCLSSIDKRMRFRPLHLVKKEIAFFIEKEIPQIKFVDRTFNANHAHAIEIWRTIRELDKGITNFHFEIAADILTDEEISFLAKLRPGLVQFEIGVQTTNPRTIEEIHRKTDLSAVRSAVGRILKAGNIHVHLDLIAGLPYEDYESFAESFRTVYAWKPDQLQLGFLKVLKGSYLYERQREYGMIFGSRPPYEVMRTRWISYDDLLKIKLVEEMLEVYYNSGQFEVTMKLLDVLYEDAFAFFLELGQFYENEGFLGASYSRIRRSEILYAFLRKEGRAPEELIEESLLFDLYYRENMKSRPYWAKNPSEFKKVTKTFCRRGNMSHIEPFSYHFPKKEERTVKELPERLSEEVYVLFEYDMRDMLTHQAKVTEMTKREAIEKCGNGQKRY